jgi:hypothetical protein
MLKDIRTLEALARLRNNDDFQAVVTWLEHRKQENWSKAIYSDSGHTEMFKGMARETDAIITDIAEAPKTLNSLKGKS